MIKHGELQFDAYSHQKHRFSVLVRTAVPTLKWSSRRGGQLPLNNLYCVVFHEEIKWNIDVSVLINDRSSSIADNSLLSVVAMMTFTG